MAGSTQSCQRLHVNRPKTTCRPTAMQIQADIEKNTSYNPPHGNRHAEMQAQIQRSTNNHPLQGDRYAERQAGCQQCTKYSPLHGDRHAEMQAQIQRSTNYSPVRGKRHADVVLSSVNPNVHYKPLQGDGSRTVNFARRQRTLAYAPTTSNEITLNEPLTVDMGERATIPVMSVVPYLYKEHTLRYNAQTRANTLECVPRDTHSSNHQGPPPSYSMAILGTSNINHSGVDAFSHTRLGTETERPPSYLTVLTSSRNVSAVIPSTV